ncbi:MAG: bifunctional diaminohydroxyphosphoribosylaminopyrimidine deaminase/5-amino-6-(5-phosphoribosylamino)uracil reductase RibD [Acidimicrobiia bacterium]|nr:bifunctional diaminohydroxyphosphoribosylaminopyrimidine deaminase/5-amino-6-(5-phosphoribosylamino)uracil reductase RibD [Acidimicrobiia bacterium]
MEHATSEPPAVDDATAASPAVDDATAASPAVDDATAASPAVDDATAASPAVDDATAMRLAVRAAERGRVTAPPNPWVGCVLVNDGKVVGIGHHERPGLSHAEVNALAAAGERARGATAVVTLEPCNHTGRTGPCTEALIKAGVDRVIVGVKDPDPQVAGTGISRLEAAGIDVAVGIEADLVEDSLAPYLYQRTTGSCFVVCKVASSIDGRSAAQDGTSQWITGPSARSDVHRIRAQSQAIVVGSGTALADNPTLTPRGEWEGPRPLRVVLDGRGAVSPVGHLAETHIAPTIVVTAAMADDRRAEWLAAGAEVWHLPVRGDGALDLSELWVRLAQRGVVQALVEAGPVLAGSVVEQRQFQRLITYVGSTWLGSSARPVFDIAGPATMSAAPRLSLQDVTAFDNDVRLTYAMVEPPSATDTSQGRV